MFASSTTPASPSTSSSFTHRPGLMLMTVDPGTTDPTRVVRFDNQCVLIPEHSRKRSRVVTKSVALPLWKRRSPHLSDTESADDPTSPVTPTAPEDKQIVIKVPLPSFIVRSPRSPHRTRSVSASPRVQPLSPCLVHRSASSPIAPLRRTSPDMRRGSLPVHHKAHDDSVVTVPLRACCPDCVAITEECQREDWEIRFTGGARRRRSASLDHISTRPTDVVAASSSSHNSTTTTDQCPSLALLKITVDEVDKRRRSLSEEDFVMRRDLPPLPPSSQSCSNCHDERLSIVNPRSSSREWSASNLSPQPAAHHPAARASPIQEEDEDQLFPLPSPRRTPSNSPSSSLNIDPSPKSSPVPSRRSTPAPSPTASTACVNSIIPTSRLATQSDELLTTALTRKHFKVVASDPFRNSDEIINNPSFTAPGSSHKTSSSYYSYSPSLPLQARDAPVPSSPVASSYSSSSFSSPRSSPVIPTAASPKRSKKHSFSIPFLKAGADALKGASVDVLKGVGSMGGVAGMGPTMHSLG